MVRSCHLTPALQPLPFPPTGFKPDQPWWEHSKPPFSGEDSLGQALPLKAHRCGRGGAALAKAQCEAPLLPPPVLLLFSLLLPQAFPAHLELTVCI